MLHKLLSVLISKGTEWQLKIQHGTVDSQRARSDGFSAYLDVDLLGYIYTFFAIQVHNLECL